MTPTKWILVLFAACVAWVPASVHLGRSAGSGDPQGTYSYIATFFLLVLGGVVLGSMALHLAKQHKAKIHFCTYLAAWIILLSPVIVAGAVILSELIGDLFRL